MVFEHRPVLLDETINALAILSDGIYVDGTMGGGGHSFEIAARLKNGLLIGIDQDTAAIAAAGERLSIYGSRVKIVNDNFRNIASVLKGLSVDCVNGILLDIGVSSYQLDTPERGFSYNYDAPLDMRMSQKGEKTAYHVVNGYDEGRIASVLYEYGEERFSRRIAAAIVRRREKQPINTTFELVEIIKEAIPAAARREGPHPAKRSFQAIRIEVNDELGALSEAVTQCIEVLAPGGRLCIITFHSLEDRLVKKAFAGMAQGCTCPKEFPVCVCTSRPTIKIIAKKGISPSEKELAENPRARSARLRVAQKI